MSNDVRQKLLTVAGCTPFCGNRTCSYILLHESGYCRRSTTKFNGKQFVCRCGWKSRFEPEFIAEYKQKQEELRNERN